MELNEPEPKGNMRVKEKSSARQGVMCYRLESTCFRQHSFAAVHIHHRVGSLIKGLKSNPQQGASREASVDLSTVRVIIHYGVKGQREQQAQGRQSSE